MPTITHFEIPADDVERAKRFYNELFQWEFKEAPMGYWFIETRDEDGKKGLCGGMMKREDPNQAITNYISVPSVDKYIANVQELGGRVVVPRTAVPGFGYFAVCMDTENNTFTLWRCDKNAK